MKKLTIGASVVLGLCAALAGAGCDDAGDGDGGAGATGGGGESSGLPGDDLTPESFAALYAEAFCQHQEYCCGDAGGEVDDSCEADVEAATVAAIEEALEGPNVEFSGLAAMDCLSVLDVDHCNWEAANTCGTGSVVVGTVGPGEACGSVSECIQPDDGGFSGCAPLGDDTESSCRQFQYSAVEGEECFGYDLSDPFAGDDGAVVECAAGFYCDDNTCAEKILDGDACTDNRECYRGYCIDGACQVVEIGQECSLDNDAPPCVLGANCVDGTCVQRPLLPGFGEVHACSVDP